MIKSVLAAVVAIGLIVGALYLRTNVIAPDGAGGTSGLVAEDDPVETGDLAIACDELLGAACPEGSTRLDLDGMLAAFGASPVEFEVLVAPAVVVELIEQSQTSRTTFSDGRDVVALTPFVVATAVSTDEFVADACGDAVTWSCVADLTGDRTLRPAVADAQDDSEGLLAYAALTGGFLDSPQFSANALGGAPFIGWLDTLEDQAATSPDPINNVIAFGGAQANAGVEVEATGLATVRGSQRAAANLAWPTPLASVQVVAVAVEGADQDAADDIGAVVGGALREQGWRGPDGAPVTEGPRVAPDADDGLPNGGTLFALRDRLP